MHLFDTRRCLEPFEAVEIRAIAHRDALLFEVACVHVAQLGRFRFSLAAHSLPGVLGRGLLLHWFRPAHHAERNRG